MKPRWPAVMSQHLLAAVCVCKPSKQVREGTRSAKLADVGKVSI